MASGNLPLQRREVEGNQLLKEKLTSSGIHDFLPSSKYFGDNENSSPECENNISHLSVLSQAKDYVKANFAKLSENNLLNCAEEFLKVLTFSDNDRTSINKATVGQHKNTVWHEMRHLLVTSKKK